MFSEPIHENVHAFLLGSQITDKVDFHTPFIALSYHQWLLVLQTLRSEAMSMFKSIKPASTSNKR